MRSTSRLHWARAVAEGVRSGKGRRSPALAALAIACALGAHAADAAPRTHTVVIEGLRFNPETLTVHRGDRIVWRNKDLVPHTATASGAFDSRSIAAHGSWSYVARKAGALPYVCSFHPTMKGTLKVE